MRRSTNLVGLLVAALVLTLLAPVVASAQTGTVGFRSHANLGRSSSNGGPATCCKAESKLWFHDGTWWATMIHRDSRTHRIHRLAGDTWVDTGVVVDTHVARADVLHRGDTIWITGRNTSKLARFTYASGTWSMDSGFPVSLPVPSGTPGLTIARDSTGTLWIAWLDPALEAVRTSHSTDRGSSWSSPATLPFRQATNPRPDDYAAITAFTDQNGPAVGVMWSNQRDDAQYFAVRRDGAAADQWAPLETALSGTREADDHINFATFEDRVYATIKTEQGQSGQDLIKLLRRSPQGVWSQTPVAKVEANDTRPIGVIDIDPAERRIYVFTRRSEADGTRRIVYRSSPLSGLSFPTTPTTIIQAGQDVNNVTSMKANATAASGIVVMAETSDHYWWNRIGGGGSTPPPQQYDLSVTTVGSGSVSPSGGTYDAGTTVTLTASAASGWSFDRWSGAASGTNPSTTVVMDGDRSVTATFVEDPPPRYDLTISTVGSGTVSADPPGGTYEEGTTVTLTAAPAAGWSFDRWGGAASGTEPTATVVMDGARSVTATFVEDPPPAYDLTVTTLGSGTVAVDPPQGPYEEGSTVTLTATPASGWSFDRWGGAASGTSTTTSVVMDGGRSVTATFVEDEPPPVETYALAVTTVGSGTVDVAPAGPYEAGTTVTLTAAPATGWSFGAWSGAASGDELTTTVVMDGDRSVTATFVQDDTPPPPPPPLFGDVDPASTHAAAIARLAALGITDGCAEGRYCPELPVTRAQMASFLQRTLELPLAPADGFDDVVDGSTHAAAIGAVRAAGITLGCTEDGRSYCPNQPLPRDQLASFLQRALDLVDGAEDRFTDVVPGTEHAAAIGAVAEAGITLGCSPDGLSYCPRALVSRAQMASFLDRTIDHLAP